jgi:hypothetical protein
MLRDAFAKIRSRNNHKGGRASLREALPPFVRYAKAERVCLLGSIAVTFGTLGKLFDRRGLYGKLRFEVSRYTVNFLTYADPDESLPRGNVQYLCASNNRANYDAARPS